MYLTESSLSEEHEQMLLALLIEVLGHDCPKEPFAEALLDLLENISGFEGISDARARRITDYFWRKYCGKEPN